MSKSLRNPVDSVIPFLLTLQSGFFKIKSNSKIKNSSGQYIMLFDPFDPYSSLSTICFSINCNFPENLIYVRKA
jgi:hypothetical protein